MNFSILHWFSFNVWSSYKFVLPCSDSGYNENVKKVKRQSASADFTWDITWTLCNASSPTFYWPVKYTPCSCRVDSRHGAHLTEKVPFSNWL